MGTWSPSLRAIHLDPSRLRGKVFRHEVGGGRMREDHNGPITLPKVAANRTDPVYEGKFSGWF